MEDKIFIFISGIGLLVMVMGIFAFFNPLIMNYVNKASPKKTGSRGGSFYYLLGLTLISSGIYLIVKYSPLN